MQADACAAEACVRKILSREFARSGGTFQQGFLGLPFEARGSRHLAGKEMTEHRRVRFFTLFQDAVSTSLHFLRSRVNTRSHAFVTLFLKRLISSALTFFQLAHRLR